MLSTDTVPATHERRRRAAYRPGRKASKTGSGRRSERRVADVSPKPTEVEWSAFMVTVLRGQAERLSETATASLQAASDAQRLAIDLVGKRGRDEWTRLGMVAFGAFGIGTAVGALIKTLA